MATVTTYTAARAMLASLCDGVVSTRQPVIIRRRDADDEALIAADELESIEETAHLLRSPVNAQRLLTALARALEGNDPPSSSVARLREELGFGSEEA